MSVITASFQEISILKYLIPEEIIQINNQEDNFCNLFRISKKSENFEFLGENKLTVFDLLGLIFKRKKTVYEIEIVALLQPNSLAENPKTFESGIRHWRIFKSFSDFAHLHELLQCENLAFPAKNFWLRFEFDFLESRLQDLHRYTNDLLLLLNDSDSCLNDTQLHYLHQFLGVDDLLDGSNTESILDNILKDPSEQLTAELHNSSNDEMEEERRLSAIFNEISRMMLPISERKLWQESRLIMSGAGQLQANDIRRVLFHFDDFTRSCKASGDNFSKMVNYNGDTRTTNICGPLFKSLPQSNVAQEKVVEVLASKHSDKLSKYISQFDSIGFELMDHEIRNKLIVTQENELVTALSGDEN